MSTERQSVAYFFGLMRLAEKLTDSMLEDALQKLDLMAEGLRIVRDFRTDFPDGGWRTEQSLYEIGRAMYALAVTHLAEGAEKDG